jgi:hypothetical protein
VKFADDLELLLEEETALQGMIDKTNGRRYGTEMK